MATALNTHRANGLRRATVLSLTAAASAAAGWFAHDGVSASDRATPARSAPAAIVAGPDRAADVTTTAAPDPGPLIAVASDGRVTLRVEQQPLEWVLERIAQQSGWSDVHDRARPRSAASSAMTASAVPAATTVACVGRDALVPPVDAVAVRRAIETGDERERFDALMQARSSDVDIPEHVLRALLDSGPSERVQIAALETYLERFDGQADALRQALQIAQTSPSEPVRREAGHLLEQLDVLARIEALPPLTDP